MFFSVGQLTFISILVNNGLAPIRRQAIPGTNVDQDLLHHKAQLSHNEITLNGLVVHFRLDDDLKFFNESSHCQSKSLTWFNKTIFKLSCMGPMQTWSMKIWLVCILFAHNYSDDVLDCMSTNDCVLRVDIGIVTNIAIQQSLGNLDKMNVPSQWPRLGVIP